MFYAFKLIKNLKFLRGTIFDIFGMSQERRKERELISNFEKNMGYILNGLSSDNYQSAIEIAKLPQKIRGFGHVKEKNIKEFEKENSLLLANFTHQNPRSKVAE
jgi:indolepyruvate ferredoxin oxidoreductase